MISELVLIERWDLVFVYLDPRIFAIASQMHQRDVERDVVCEPKETRRINLRFVDTELYFVELFAAERDVCRRIGFLKNACKSDLICCLLPCLFAACSCFACLPPVD